MREGALSALLVAVACTATDGGESRPSREEAAARAESLAALRGARVLLSHHSVGRDVVAGLRRLDAETPGGKLRIVPVEEALADGAPALMLASGGENGDPDSKLAFFVKTLDRHATKQPALALMKLCFVDFNPRTDSRALFERYASVVAGLERAHPGVRFAHVTAPLVAQPSDWKSRLDRWLGREVWEDAANVRRSEWNERLRAAFPKQRIFDLALAESTRPDGSKVRFEHGGRQYESLAPELTYDGGHLNERGQRAAAEAFVRFAAAALQAQRTAPR